MRPSAIASGRDHLSSVIGPAPGASPRVLKTSSRLAPPATTVSVSPIVNKTPYVQGDSTACRHAPDLSEAVEPARPVTSPTPNASRATLKRRYARPTSPETLLT